MCGRITVLTMDEIREAVECVQAGKTMHLAASQTGEGDGGLTRSQARPGSDVFALAPRSGSLDGLDLEIQRLIWGIEAPWDTGRKGRAKLVFNTRIESALRGTGMWRESLSQGRCILPAATFFETHATETAVSPSSGRTVKRAYEFCMPGGEPLLLASVREGDRLSVVTTEPNAAVARVHPRMPIALRFAEVPLWLNGSVQDIAELADRSSLDLVVAPEHLVRPAETGNAADQQLSLF